jgi:hypothetical protein
MLRSSSPRAPRHLARPLLAVAAAVLLGSATLVVGAAAPAAAAPTCPGGHDDVDTIRLDTGSSGRVDFGDDPHLFGAPQHGARVCWDVLPGGDIFVELDGELYWDDLWAGGCAEIAVDFFDRSGDAVGASLSAGWSVKSPGGLRQVNVWRQARAEDLDRVRVRLFRSNSSCAGDVQVASTSVRFGD